MALFHVSHPPWLRTVGVRTSYTHFSNISWTPQVLDPITNPFLGPSSWLYPASVMLGNGYSSKLLLGVCTTYNFLLLSLTNKTVSNLKCCHVCYQANRSCFLKLCDSCELVVYLQRGGSVFSHLPCVWITDVQLYLLTGNRIHCVIPLLFKNVYIDRSVCVYGKKIIYQHYRNGFSGRWHC